LCFIRYRPTKLAHKAGPQGFGDKGGIPAE